MFIDVWADLQIAAIGFIGGLTGTCLGLQGARQFLLRSYLRYTRVKDYDKLRNSVFELLQENKKLKNTLKSIKKDIYELYTLQPSGDSK